MVCLGDDVNYSRLTKFRDHPSRRDVSYHLPHLDMQPYPCTSQISFYILFLYRIVIFMVIGPYSPALDDDLKVPAGSLQLDLSSIFGIASLTPTPMKTQPALLVQLFNSIF